MANDYAIKIFAQNAINLSSQNNPAYSQISQYGSKANGSLLSTNDPATIQALTQYTNGFYYGNISNKNLPTYQDMNGLFFNITTLLQNMQQYGSAYYWLAVVTYSINATIINQDGNVYKSLQNNNLGNPPTTATSNAFWQYCGNIANFLTTSPNSAIGVQTQSSGFVNIQNEPNWNSGLGITFSGNIITISAINQLTFIRNPQSSTLASKTISVPQQTFNVATNALVPVVAGNAQRIYYLCYNSSGGFQVFTNIVNITSDVVLLCAFYVVYTAGVPALSTSNPITPLVSVSQTPWNAKAFLDRFSFAGLTPNANLTVNLQGGLVGFEGANYPTSRDPIQISRLIVAAQPTLSFKVVNGGTPNTNTVPALTTAVPVTQYWNGTAVVNVPNNNATVMRFLLTAAGGLLLQLGGAVYANLGAASNAISVAPFTDLSQSGIAFREVARVAVLQNATALNNTTQAVWQSATVTSGSAFTSTVHNSLAGLQQAPISGGGFLPAPTDTNYNHLSNNQITAIGDAIGQTNTNQANINTLQTKYSGQGFANGTTDDAPTLGVSNNVTSSRQNGWYYRNVSNLNGTGTYSGGIGNGNAPFIAPWTGLFRILLWREQSVNTAGNGQMLYNMYVGSAPVPGAQQEQWCPSAANYAKGSSPYQILINLTIGESVDCIIQQYSSFSNNNTIGYVTMGSDIYQQL